VCAATVTADPFAAAATNEAALTSRRLQMAGAGLAFDRTRIGRADDNGRRRGRQHVAKLSSYTEVAETTVNRVSAMTLIIPIRQGLEPPFVIGKGADGYPTFGIGDGPWVRPVENLRTVFGAVAALAGARVPMGLNEVGTIHYARWVIINDGEDMLFCANFDSSLDQYLTDFMVIANTPTAPYMDALWGRCVDYPGGEPTTFIDWARRWQIDTTLFFPTISDVTVRDIYWLRQFRKLFTDFDKVAQEIPADQWPPALRDEYEKLKAKANNIDLSVII
jgi:hypothetical protein